jgi:predicted MPP superfamily phosphohydrolase
MIRLLFQHMAVSLLVITIAGQGGCLLLWLAGFKSPVARKVIMLAFLAFNLAWAATVVMITRGAMFGGVFWPWIGRPAVSWQLVSFFVLFPASALLLIYGLARVLCWMAGARRGPKAVEAEKVEAPEGGESQLELKWRPAPSQDGPEPPRKASAPSGSHERALAPRPPLPNPQALPKKLTRRDFLRQAGAGGLVTVAAVSGYGLLRQSVSPNVARKTLKFQNLPPELSGFKICQISDIHLGMWQTQAEMARAFEKAAEEKPDLVVLTGDLVDQDPKNSLLFYEPLGAFDGVPHGVYAILGNHDHYTGASEVAMLLGRRINMLVQKRALLKNAPVTIVGLDDPGSRGSFLGARWKRENLDKDPDVLSFNGVLGPPFRQGDFNLLLNHRPEGYRQASGEGFNLYLAGHTHGGQYQVPFFKDLNLAAIFYRYSSGVYSDHPCYLNVSRGLGSVGLPFRVVAWPEMDLITLASA